MPDNLDQFTKQLEKDSDALNVIIQDLIAYEIHLSALSPDTQDALIAYGVDILAPIQVKEALEELLKGEIE